MKSFIANPKTSKIEVVEGDPGTGILSYRFDNKKVTNSDITQILQIVRFVMGSLNDTIVIMEPFDQHEVKVILSIKHRQNITLGIYRLTKNNKPK